MFKILKKENIPQLILILLSLVLTAFSISTLNNFERFLSDIYYYIIYYTVTFTLLLVILKYIKEEFSTIAYILNILLSIIFLFLNNQNYLAYFFTLFYLILILLKKEDCIDKFIKKVDIAKTLSLFLSVLLFVFVMNPIYFSKIYSNYIESSNFEKIVQKNVDLIMGDLLNNKTLDNIIKREIEKKKKEMTLEFEKEKQEILNNRSIPENYKEELIKKLENQKQEAIKKLEEQIKEQVLLLKKEDTKEDIIKKLKEIMKDFLKKQGYVKIITAFLLFSIYSLLNTISTILATLIILAIDIILNLFIKYFKKI